MTPESFDFLSAFVKEHSGLILNKGKEYLLEHRLLPLARNHGVDNIDALVEMMRRPGSGQLGEAVVDAMTTNESFFFRDKTPFDQFESTMLPAMLENRSSQRKFRIWCAAASTGQEPYSLAMCLKEAAEKLLHWRIEILGTDLSAEVLEKAKAGMYSQFEVQRGLPIKLLVKYFKQIGELWQVDAALKAMVTYKPLNLMKDFSALGKFDIVFCRNVLIYFDQPTKKLVLERIARQLAPDGFLVLGAAETVIGITDVFRPVPGHRGLYAPRAGAADDAAPARSAVPGATTAPAGFMRTG